MTLTLAIEPLKRKISQDIAILHICGKFNQNRFMNEGARAMTLFFFLLKIDTVTLTLALEHSNLNLSKKLSY